MSDSLHLGDLTTDALERVLREHSPAVALLPVGSTEPHGPHLPLSTDLVISEGAALAAARDLRSAGVFTVIAPGVPYGVTDYAGGFSGAISIPREALVAFLRAIVDGLLAQGFAHVCLVNNHLEPAHDAAVRAAIAHVERQASVACPLTRRWARTLTPEFKSGACHAGRYETSLVLAVAPELVDMTRATALPELTISLSDGIKNGLSTFREMGIDRAYTGAPSQATEAEGQSTLSLLAQMIVTEVTDHLPQLGAPNSGSHP